MTYHVLYRLSTGALLDIEIPAANDTELLHNALALLPTNATLEDFELPEAA